MKLQGFSFLVFTTGLLLSPWAMAKNDVSPPVAVYTLSDYAQYLGLTQQQYMNLSSAMMATTETKVGFQYEPIQEHSAFIEQINLLRSGQPVPRKLQREVKRLFRKNLNRLADYVGVPRGQIAGLVSQYGNLVHTINSMENIRLAREQGSFVIQDEVERIVVTAPLDKIVTTSSDIYTLYTPEIWNFGVEAGGGSMVNIKVNFVNAANGKAYGSQTWTVSRAAAFPNENLKCTDSGCKLDAF